MTSTSSNGGPSSTANGHARGGTRPPSDPTPVGRALAVLVAFGVVSALVLGQLHPGNASGAGQTPASAPSAVAGAVAKHTPVPAKPTTTTTIPPSQIPVLAANGAGVANVAADATAIVKAAGYATLTPANATTSVQTSGVYFVAGQQAAADAVANLLHFPATSVHPLDTSVPVTSTAGADVVVVIGTDEGNAVAALAAGG